MHIQNLASLPDFLPSTSTRNDRRSRERTLQMKGGMRLCDFTRLELTAALCQQPSVPPKFCMQYFTSSPSERHGPVLFSIPVGQFG